MSFRSKPQRANSFSLSSPFTSSFNKVLTLTRHSSTNDVNSDNADTRSDIISHNFSFRRKATQAYSRVRKSVTNSAPSSRSKSAPHLFDKPLVRPVDIVEGVLVFSTANNGFSCNLVFTQISIVFDIIVAKKDTNIKNNHVSSLNDRVAPDVPRRSKPKNRMKSLEDIESVHYLNISSVNVQRTNLMATIEFQLRNFKMLKLQIPFSSPKYGENMKMTVIKNDLDRICQFFQDVCEQNIWRERGRPMILEKDAINSKSCLWEYLYRKYPLVNLTDFSEFDWAERERLINFVPINDSHLSQTLPPLIPVLPGIKQSELEDVGHYSADQRIPIVCYVYPKTKKLLIRSTTFSLSDKIDFVQQSVSKSIHVLDVLGKHLDINDSYERLKKCTFNAIKNSQNSKTLHNNSALFQIDKSKKFWSKCNGWLVGVSRALKLSNDIATELRDDRSIAIFEPFDCEWNCVISSLVQVMIEPACRTMEGFEKLISKEWLYFPGFKRNAPGKQPVKKYIVRVPSSTMFNLFLDAVHQLINQNPRIFQFSSAYLILLLDSSFQGDSNERNFDDEFTVLKAQPELKNILYSSECDCQLTVDTHITNIRFFNALFFRQVRIDNFHYAVPETMQREFLKKGQL